MTCTPIETTDLFPTRYEAFGRPGVIFRFAPAADGTVAWCRRDANRRPAADFASLTSELVVFHRPRPDRKQPGDRDGYDYAEVSRTKDGTHWVRLETDGSGRRVRVATLDEAIAEVQRFADAEPPHACGLTDYERSEIARLLDHEAVGTWPTNADHALSDALGSYAVRAEEVGDADTERQIAAAIARLAGR